MTVPGPSCHVKVNTVTLSLSRFVTYMRLSAGLIAIAVGALPTAHVPSSSAYPLSPRLIDDTEFVAWFTT